jgi:hypothetical protein
MILVIFLRLLAVPAVFISVLSVMFFSSLFNYSTSHNGLQEKTNKREKGQKVETILTF